MYALTAWYVNIIALVVASGIDLRTRRIPNWLTVPLLVSGVASQMIFGGWQGLGDSFGGIGLALLIFGAPCFLRGMGMGDLKLAAGAGAWIGPGQALLAFVVAGIVGGAMAVLYALRHRSLSRCLDSTGDLIVRLSKGNAGSQDLTLGSPAALSIPYAPAITIGTLFSFFAV